MSVLTYLRRHKPPVSTEKSGFIGVPLNTVNFTFTEKGFPGLDSATPAQTELLLSVPQHLSHHSIFAECWFIKEFDIFNSGGVKPGEIRFYQANQYLGNMPYACPFYRAGLPLVPIFNPFNETKASITRSETAPFPGGGGIGIYPSGQAAQVTLDSPIYMATVTMTGNFDTIGLRIPLGSTDLVLIYFGVLSRN